MSWRYGKGLRRRVGKRLDAMRASSVRVLCPTRGYGAEDEEGGADHDRLYTAEQVAWLQAIDHYKRSAGRPFPTWAEVLRVAKAIGYRLPELGDDQAGAELGDDQAGAEGRPA